MTNSFPNVSGSPLGYSGLDPYVNPPFINANRAPTTNDIQLPGTLWEDGSASPQLLYTTTGNGVWALNSSTAGTLNTLTASSGGPLTPVGNNINILGTASQITTAGAGATITLSLPAAVTFPGSAATTTTLAVGTDLTVGGTAQFTGVVEFLGLIDFDGGLEVVGGTTTDTLHTTSTVTMDGAGSVITIGDAAQTATITLGSSTAANSVLIQDGINVGAQVTSIANGATAAASVVNILSGAGSAGTSQLLMADNPRVATIDLGNVAPAAARVTTIAGGNSAQNDTVSIFPGAPSANAQIFNLFSGNATGGTQTVNIGTGTNAAAINIGTGATGIKTIHIGGTAANAVTLANTQTAGSLLVGGAMVGGTITLGGTTNTGILTIAPSTAVAGQVINFATGAGGVKTIHIGDGAIDNIITVGSNTGTAVTTIKGGSGGVILSAAASSATATFTAGTGLIATTGGVTASAGNIVATLGDITASAGNIAATLGSVTAGTTVTATLGDITATNGNLSLATAGNKLKIATGANASMGTTVAMIGGTTIVSTTAVKTGSTIFLSYNTLSGTPGSLEAETAQIIDSTSFVINSSSALDTSTVNWLVVN